MVSIYQNAADVWVFREKSQNHDNVLIGSVYRDEHDGLGRACCIQTVDINTVTDNTSRHCQQRACTMHHELTDGISASNERFHVYRQKSTCTIAIISYINLHQDVPRLVYIHRRLKLLATTASVYALYTLTYQIRHNSLNFKSRRLIYANTE
jgi:hypothetical protein